MIYRFEVEMPDDLPDEVSDIMDSLSDWMDGEADGDDYTSVIDAMVLILVAWDRANSEVMQ